MTAAAIFAAVSAAYAAGHWAGDYWVQTHRQACAKGAPGWPGRRACAAHVATYTATPAMDQMLRWHEIGSEYLADVRILPQVHKLMQVL